jgi:hypothetical protein
VTRLPLVRAHGNLAEPLRHDIVLPDRDQTALFRPVPSGASLGGESSFANYRADGAGSYQNGGDGPCRDCDEHTGPAPRLRGV